MHFSFTVSATVDRYSDYKVYLIYQRDTDDTIHIGLNVSPVRHNAV